MQYPYYLEGWQKPGVLMVTRHALTIQDLKQQMHGARENFPQATFVFGNADNADMGFNGLTEEEEAFLEDRCFSCGGEGTGLACGIRCRNCRDTRYFVAVYEMDRAFGGHEEGGWWYDTGVLMRVMALCKTRESARKIARRINSLLEYRRKLHRIRPLSSVAYAGGHYEAKVCEHFAPEHFPQERPYYE